MSSAKTASNHKRCVKCGAEKELSDFYRHIHNKTGYDGTCKSCKRIYMLQYRKKNKEKLSAQELEYRTTHKRHLWKLKQSPEAKAKARMYAKQSRVKYPCKERARAAIKNALKSKKITKPTQCLACGENKKLEGHHPDYKTPLFVVWLCRPCHHRYHRGTTAKANGIRKRIAHFITQATPEGGMI